MMIFEVERSPGNKMIKCKTGIEHFFTRVFKVWKPELTARDYLCTMHINFEFKARAKNILELEALLLQQNPEFIGEDFQTDTYFNVPYGRLKMREGNIENALIHYHRNDVASAKQSDVILYKHNADASLKKILATALGIKVVVEKKRRIYFMGNVKFHFDEVTGLGKFVEVEAIDTDGSIGIEKLKQQCNHYASLFGITDEEFVSRSYSDLLLAKKSSTS